MHLMGLIIALRLEGLTQQLMYLEAQTLPTLGLNVLILLLFR